MKKKFYYKKIIQKINKIIEIFKKLYNNKKKINKNINISIEAKAFNLSGIHKSKYGDFDGAIKDYNEAIKLSQNYAKAYYNRGYAKFLKNYFCGALKDYNKAIELNSKYDKAYNNRGLIKFLISENLEAIKDLNEAIKLNPCKEYYNNRKHIQGKFEYIIYSIEDF